MAKNPTEKLLEQLGKRAFLSLWSHNNLFMKHNEELCDLFACVDNTVVLFEIKDFTYNSQKSFPVTWERILKKIENPSNGAMHQLVRAQKHLEKHPQDIYEDPKCQQKYKGYLNSEKKINFFRIAIVMGVSDACKDYFNGKKTLQINTKSKELFTLNNFYYKDEFIHIFDDLSFLNIINELDTFPDLIGYLIQKESLFKRKDIISESEMDLMASYIATSKKFPIASKIIESSDSELIVFPNALLKLKESKEYISRNEFYRLSYFLDNTIEWMINEKDAYTAYKDDNPFKEYKRKELLLRDFTKYPRAFRSIIADNIFKEAKLTLRRKERWFHFCPKDNEFLCFIIIPYRMDHDKGQKYRIRQTQALFSLLLSTIKRNPKAKKFTGIAFDKIMIRKDGSIKFGKPPTFIIFDEIDKIDDFYEKLKTYFETKDKVFKIRDLSSENVTFNSYNRL